MKILSENEKTEKRVDSPFEVVGTGRVQAVADTIPVEWDS